MFLHCCISESKEKLLFCFYCRHGWHRALLLIFAFGNYEEGCNCMANFQSGTNEWSIPLWLHCIAMNSTIKTQRSIKQCLKTDCCPWTFLCVSETSEIIFILFFFMFTCFRILLSNLRKNKRHIMRLYYECQATSDSNLQ